MWEQPNCVHHRLRGFPGKPKELDKTKEVARKTPTGEKTKLSQTKSILPVSWWDLWLESSIPPMNVYWEKVMQHKGQ